MIRRRLLLLALPVALMLLGGGTFALWPRISAITRDNGVKIHKGMPLAEVEAVLGGPARNDTTGPLRTNIDGPSSEEAYHCRWLSDEVIIIVCFDAQDRVQCSGCHTVERQSAIDRLRRWLHL